MTTDRSAFAAYTDPATFARIRDYSTVVEMWQMCISEYADSIAIEDDGKKYTFAELDRDCALFRTVLVDAGLKKGDRVCLLSVNSYDFVKALLACATLGITAAVLPAQLDEGSVFGCTMMFGAKALICHPALEGSAKVAVANGVKVISTSATADVATPVCDDVCGDDGCVIMFTGGTTGRSKGALLSHRAVMQGAINGCYGYDSVFDQRYLLILPLSHVFGLIRNLMTSLYTGSTLFICRNNKDMFRDIAMFRPTILVMVPALAEMALNLSRQFGKNMLGDDLKYIICGAAVVPQYLVTEYGKYGIKLCPGYGLTESANLVSGNPDAEKKPTSVGIFYPNQEYRIVDGELWLKGDNMMDGYVGMGSENEESYQDGWFRTGDLVRVDDDGYLYITGRIKEIILLSNGENVSPAEVEMVFNNLAIVQDSQLYEDVDESGRHFLALEVVPRMAELGKVDAEDKNAYLMAELERVNATLPSYQRAVKIIIRDSDFERTPSMKIVRYNKCK